MDINMNSGSNSEYDFANPPKNVSLEIVSDGRVSETEKSHTRQNSMSRQRSLISQIEQQTQTIHDRNNSRSSSELDR